MSGRRVLVATFGSAGDLFPLVPVIDRLAGEGWEVRVAAGRASGLYLRALGLPTVGLGDGTELRVVRDPAIVTIRFDGWSSWRGTVTEYVVPTLARDVGTLDAVLADWAPDAVLVSGFAPAARIAARRAGVPAVEASIYPQHAALAATGRGWCRGYRRAVAELAGEASAGSPVVSRLAWGAPAEVLLHDRALLGPGPGPDPVGFPSWDAVAGGATEAEAADRWLAADGPTVLVTLGSFLGSATQRAWRAAAEAVADRGLRGLLVGARGAWAQEALGGRADLLCTGFLPLSELLPRVAAAVHHGGIGTTFAALRAGCPAVVVPQAFDQPHNARMVERAGVGVDGAARPLGPALAAALAPGARERTAEVAAALVPASDAAAATAAAVRRAAGRPGARVRPAEEVVGSPGAGAGGTDRRPAGGRGAGSGEPGGGPGGR